MDVARAESIRLNAAAIRRLVHPITLAALVVLTVNDHLLKAWYPGVLTGKLIDAAGLVLAPITLAAVVAVCAPRVDQRHITLGAVAFVGIGFTAMKVSALGASVASAGWSALVGRSVVLADVTDLVTLPALAIVLWMARRDAGSRQETGFAVLVVLPLAMMAMVATPAPEVPPNAGLVVYDTTEEPVLIGGAYNPDDTWSLSHDAGLTWSSNPDRRTPKLSMVVRSACAPERLARCYRVVPGHLRVDQSDDFGRHWVTCWEVTDRQRVALARRFHDLGDVTHTLSSNSLAIVPVGESHVVVVANGRDGYARRDLNGRWTRIGFGSSIDEDGQLTLSSAEPIPPPSTRDAPVELTAAVLLGTFTMLIGALAMLWRRQRSPAAVIGSGWFATAGFTLLCAVGLRYGDGDLFMPAGLGIGLLMTLGFALVALLLAGSIARQRWRTLAIAAVAITAGSVAAVVATRYAYGETAYRSMMLSAIGVATAAIALAVRIGAARPVTPVPDTG